MENEVQKLWNYYRDAAELLGAKRSTEDTSKAEGKAQKNFSVLTFYEACSDPEKELNDITLAFLGDDAAFQRLGWDEPLPEQWEDWLLEAEKGKDLNEDQKEAIKKALGNAVSVIIGPPGTGKTETILNLLSCIGRQGKTAAVVSWANSATNDIYKKIQECKNPEQENRMWLKGHFARLGNQSNKKEFETAGPGVSFANAENFLKQFPIISSTINSLRNCFEDDKKYCYDYVIIDEVSQVNLVLGIVAMGAARHLVLVGDSAQLPPVIHEEELRGLGDGTIQDWYKIKGGKSFLDVCGEVLQKKGRLVETELTFHYRCHPDIIEFCNRAVYQKKLKLKKPFGEGPRVPIKVLWFEGDYQDKFFKENKNGKVWSSKKNMKQALIFMEEEWPELKKRFQEQKQQGEGLESVCILTPFKGQALTLQGLLQSDIERNGINVVVTVEGKEADDGEQGQVFPVLTIHKSQGREYDIVYLLPVDDRDWQWPWSQKMQLVNVAVSRAKEELRLILSASLMEAPLQMELTGRYIPPAETLNMGMAEEQRSPEGQRYVQKLVSYVKERSEEAGVRRYPDSDYEFGFHRARRRSIYDQNAWLNFTKTDQRDSAPERCVRQALEAMCGAWKAVLGVELLVHDHVRLKTIRTWTGKMPKLDGATLDEKLNIAFLEDILDKGLPPQEAGDQAETVKEDANADADAALAVAEEMQQLVDHGGHLDFVICYGDRILVAIEVDGAGHGRPMERRGQSAEGGQRVYEAQKRRDERKNDLLHKVFGADCYVGNVRKEGAVLSAESAGTFAFIRLPTDGTTCLETMELWNAAPKELQDKYFPIEDLIKIQLSRRDFAKEGRAYRVFPKEEP